MKTSRYQNRPVLYVDKMRLQHSGVVVGESEDGAWQFVASDHPGAPPATKGWHFQVLTEMTEGILQTKERA